MNETEIFARALEEQDVNQRAQLVDKLCHGDQQLKSRVEKLLGAHDHPATFLEGPFIDSNNDATIDPAPHLDYQPSLEQAGSMVGPYKLLQQIGEGGMGMVFMAEQTEPVKRRVALKIIKPGMDSRQIIARFEAERQALAMMDHPNIAKVLDAGTTDRGHPYFVMELVNGVPITEYCDREKMKPEDRLNLFVNVCRTVQHAHQKGVIHRDLKPSNILVAEYDGRPVAKVIDFGVAKATGSQLTDKTLFTEFGQVIGTLEFMSPEQARRNQLDVDTRSDIYSLGIVLYSLLTGETPFSKDRFQNAAWDEMLKIIREEEPQRPSIKLSTSQSRNQVADQRGVEPNRLSSLVSGDLDWIVMKTLEKDRNRRYASANELADDIARHLTQQPVIARPPSMLDRVSKFVRRNRVALFVTLDFLVVGGLLIGWLAYSANQRSRETEARTARIEQAINDANLAIVQAEVAQIGNDAAWDTATAQCQRVEDQLNSGAVNPAALDKANELLERFAQSKTNRQLATEIENVVIRGATNQDLGSWQNMEREMRDFFREHGFDLDQEDPAAIGLKIRDHPSSYMWSDLLELWIGTRGQMAVMGGPKLTATVMQPWADAIYAADDDPIRTGIRRFIYEGPPFTREKLERLVAGVDLSTLTPRTLSWLATCYMMCGAFDKCDRVYEVALDKYPGDLMLNYDYAYALAGQKRWQHAARMYHRCLAIRSDVPGTWIGLAKALDELEETDAAQRARDQATQTESKR